MASFGMTIRRARERRRITLADVSRETRIGLHYLAALERNDFRKLPGGGLNRGYVRSYAKLIGADAEAMVWAYVAEEKARGIEDKTEDLELLKSSLAAAADRRGENGRPRRRTGRPSRIPVVATLLVVAVVALAGWNHFARELRQSDRARRTTAASSSVLAPPRAARTEDEAADLPVAAPLPRQNGLPQQERGTRASVGPGGHLSVSHLGVGSEIVDHQLQGRSDRFEEGRSVWFWTRVTGGRDGDVIRHVWHREGKRVGVTMLKLGGPLWRTQSRRPMEPGSAGRWSVEVRDAQDRLLGREQFVCVPPNSSASAARASRSVAEAVEHGPHTPESQAPLLDR